MATRGCLLKIFLPGDFPDLSSGSLRQIIVQEKSEVFINVEANTLKTFPQVRALPKEQRKCKFSYEEETEFGHYTSSNCFVSCKLKSIRLLCNCVPFMMPLSNKSDMDMCNLVDIPCLSRYKGKWLRYYPFETVEKGGLNLDFEDSLSCSGCLPNCNDVLYSIDTNYIEFYSEDFDNNYPNSSRIHVFSNKAFTNHYKKFLTVTWYESLSTFGGIVSLLLGMSIINFVEIALLLVKLLVFKIKML
ncbi:unnamed protein product [Ceutorhynchus assimilis]|uniref:Sodium channel protein Nach n=1 Tax=Ceutorhynchus assimilis TaxID=467358 RepID=A0A9N9MU31_9CUCU|nr:unnamed protein product [Ceutorhynchus assimilis]